MDKKVEISISDKIKRQLASELKKYGFKRTKPTFYTRSLNDRIEFIHIHKFTFGPAFRIHIGARFYVDNAEYVHLNGIDSDQYRPEYNLKYDEDENSINNCMNIIIKFVTDIGFQWYKKWENHESLLYQTESPLTDRLKEPYKKFIYGEIDRLNYEISCKALGIKN